VRARAAPAHEADTAAGKRERRNKYAEYSHADEGFGAKFERGELGGPVQKKSRVRRRPIPNRARGASRERGKTLYPDSSAVDPSDPSTFGFCEIGRVVGAHGVRGQVKVLSDSDFGEERLCTPGERYLKTPNRRAPREVAIVAGVRAKQLKEGQGAIYLVQLEGVDDREGAEALKGCAMFARLEAVPSALDAQRDEYLVRQLVGCEVRLMPDGVRAVGRVVGMICADEISGSPGLGNDLLDIEKCDGGGGGTSSASPERIFIPFVAALCPHVDVANKLILVNEIPGLLDLVQPPEVEEVFIRGLLPPAATATSADERAARA
jgi:16S rRNA processing protein RimM